MARRNASAPRPSGLSTARPTIASASSNACASTVSCSSFIVGMSCVSSPVTARPSAFTALASAAVRRCSCASSTARARSAAASASIAAARWPWAQPSAYPAVRACCLARSIGALSGGTSRRRSTANLAAAADSATVPRSTERSSDGRPSGDELIVLAATLDLDLAGVLERTDHRNDLLLRLLDHLDLDRAEQVDLLQQVLPAAFGEVAGDLVADRLGDSLERGGQIGRFDLAQHQLHRTVVQVDDVLEHEHPPADLLGDFGAARLQ